MISAWGWLLQDDNDHSGPLHSTLHLISFTECLCLVLIIDYLLLTLVWTRWLVPHHLSGSLWYSSCNSIYISHKLCKLIRFQFNMSKFSLNTKSTISMLLLLDLPLYLMMGGLGCIHWSRGRVMWAQGWWWPSWNIFCFTLVTLVLISQTKNNIKPTLLLWNLY